MGGITDYIQSVVVIIAAYLLVALSLAYVGYFVGMVIALAAGFILGVATAIIPVIFAWAFMAIATVLFLKATVDIK